MKRFLLAAGCLAGLVFVCPAFAQDEIKFFNRKTQKEDSIKGTIEKETAQVIAFKLSTGRKDEVPSFDVLDVIYKPPGGLAIDYRKPFLKEDKAVAPTTKDDERKQLIKEALKDYADLVPKLTDQPFIKRNLEYRLARLLARAAEDEPGQLDAALEALARFRADYPDSWQFVPCSKLLATLRELSGNTAAAQKIYEDLAASEALPKDARQEFSLAEARLLIRANQHEAALKKLKDVAGDIAADDPRQARIQVYVTACNAAAGKIPDAEKQLTELIAGKADNDAKALACNALGDLHLRDGKAGDAFWDYLWVDVLYNQDREEHAKALFQLSKLFEQVKKDPTRAQQCLDRLVNEKEFTGSPYQKLAAKQRLGNSNNK
jgi:hypothetical protein